jgi:hypothetical protein
LAIINLARQIVLTMTASTRNIVLLLVFLASIVASQQLGDYEFCSSSDQCANGCCSSVYSDDGKLKCTPVGGFNADICLSSGSSLGGDWELCSSSDQCANGCCSSVYSDDGKPKCTPVGGFNADSCVTTGNQGPTPTPPNLKDTQKWVGATGMGGLKLELLNALSEDWQGYYSQAVNDWNSGTPDALTLSTTRITVESACDPVDGKMKVCNGNYGDTSWAGLNTRVFNSDGIIWSTAKMNDFHLANSDSDRKQYTMCHEVGHGFGLPHTDEDMNNPVLGDCLDYTQNDVNANINPGRINYEKLAAMYGVVGRRRLHRTSAAGSYLMKEGGAGDYHDKEPSSANSAGLREELKQKMRHLESNLERAHEEGWVLMRQTDFGQYHVVDLGDGYHAHVNVLLAANP